MTVEVPPEIATVAFTFTALMWPYGELQHFNLAIEVKSSVLGLDFCKQGKLTTHLENVTGINESIHAAESTNEKYKWN